MPYILLNPATAAAAPASTAGAPLTSVGATLATLQADLREELGNRSDVDDPKAAKWINKAYQYLCSILTIKELFRELTINTVAAQPLYLIPTNVAFVRQVSLIDAVTYPVEGGIDLSPIDFDTYRKLPDDATNYPSAWFREQRMIVIYPTPRAVYPISIDFKVRPADLVNPTDSPIIPAEFHEALLLRAKHTAWRALKAFTEAGMARNDFVTDLGAVENTDAKEEVFGSVRPVRSARDINRLRYND
jgi:hypothetical protein